MTIKQRLDAGQGATILLVGDSITGDQTFMHPYRIAELLAAQYPTAQVVFKSRTQGGTTTTDTVVRTGVGQIINVIRDGIPGSTSYRADQRATIFSVPVDFASAFLGVNDAVNFGLSSSYTPSIYCANMNALVLYGQQSGIEMAVITPAWSDASPRTEIAGVAWLARRVAKILGAKIVDARRIFEDHFTGTGNAGQGCWFADPNDPTHFGREGHYAIADEFMRINGWV